MKTIYSPYKEVALKPVSEAEWQSLLSSHAESDNFVIDVLGDVLNRVPEEITEQMDQDLGE